MVKIDRAQDAFRYLLKRLGYDPKRSGLVETPLRAWKAWEYWTSGTNVHPAAVLKTFEDGAEGYDEMVFQGGIPFWSTCEHHLAPFFGVAHIGYIPDGKIVGLSKLARLVDIFARRLTVQERITTQVADALMNELNAKGAGVVLLARHSCMESRGVQKSGTITTTSAVRGIIKDSAETRAEFMGFVNTASSGIKSL